MAKDEMLSEIPSRVKANLDYDCQTFAFGQVDFQISVSELQRYFNWHFSNNE